MRYPSCGSYMFPFCLVGLEWWFIVGGRFDYVCIWKVCVSVIVVYSPTCSAV